MPSDTAPALLRALFVYYRVPAHARATALAAVGEMQTQLMAQWAGLQANLLQRSDTPTDTPEWTWMETYAHPEGVSDVLMKAIADLAQAQLSGLTGDRHVESFVPLAASAA
jgi:Domain of unknown function (DUF4936)